MNPQGSAYPAPSSAAVTALMRSNSSRVSRPEINLRKALHSSGLRFRKNYSVETCGLRVNIDIAFPKARLAVFVDGCFWHGCGLHGNQPRVNQAYWRRKLSGNVERDRRVDSCLALDGWRVLRLWEHVSCDDAVAQVAEVLRGPNGDGNASPLPPA